MRGRAAIWNPNAGIRGHLEESSVSDVLEKVCTFQDVEKQIQPHGAKHFSISEELGPDMSRLQDVIVKELFFYHVKISEIPAWWFSNHTIHMLVVRNCPLRDIGEAAIVGMGQLFRLILEHDQLESLPSGLSAATRLRTLQIRRNPIKFLTGVLQLPALTTLNLRSNEIEKIDEKFLLVSPNLKHLSLSGNRIQHIPNRLFKKTRKLETIDFRDNRIMAISNLFDGLLNLQVRFSGKANKSALFDSLITPNDRVVRTA
ncbi:hypothetical protein HPB48_000750 [Haemaphysalis longicornis]|uniref:Uncharacterized protein n=1 Tax=Haemaphysalis longicornis TaxID=44386 RepID=A0A9J6FIW3_HAELO|nr:hypothetical protein HPB48_000750 [Haemaphysalis longicornis]